VRLKEIGEFGFIRRISGPALIRRAGVVRGIGDDAAVFQADPAKLLLLTTDLLVEGVHFLRDLPPDALGYKSLAASLSDIGAMGGRPLDAYLSLAIPPDLPVEYLDEFYRGLYAAAAEHDVNVLGGDTTSSLRDFFVNVALTGEVAPDQVVYRHGAQPGDGIFVNGALGDSAGGLEILLNRWPVDTPAAAALWECHVRPHAGVREGQWLAQSGAVTAMIDTSDGLSSDLGHLCEESQVGARVEAAAVPLSDALKQLCAARQREALPLALHGGEDYRLLFTVRPDRTEELAEGYRQTFGQPLYRLGEIRAEPGMELVRDGKVEPLARGGYEHFRSE
jgi:thiamine-monophosphate kinase